jgi:hypothetical protein
MLQSFSPTMRVCLLTILVVAVVVSVGSQSDGGDGDDDDDELGDIASIMQVGPMKKKTSSQKSPKTSTKSKTGSGECAAGQRDCNAGSTEPLARQSYVTASPELSGAAQKKTPDPFQSKRKKVSVLSWPCNSIKISTLTSLQNDAFFGEVAAAAERGTRELLFETLTTTRPASNVMAPDNANVHSAFTTAFDWAQHGDEFYCRAQKADPKRRARNCTGWSKITASAPWGVMTSGSTVGTKDLDKQLSRFPHLYNPRRRTGSPKPAGAEFRTWVVVGGDIPNGLIGEYGGRILASGYFGRVLVEGLTHPFTQLEDVGVAPIGLTELYLSRLSPTILADQVGRADRLFPDGKSGVFAAWGAYYGFLDDHIPSRESADTWLKQTELASREMVPQGIYFTRLAESRFSICPAGRGVQSPKIMEALLTKTIPITPRDPAFVELVNLGFPLVAIDSWEEITAAKLDAWWKELSPRLSNARWILMADIWAAFVLHPCPGSITSFVASLKAGKCPRSQC